MDADEWLVGPGPRIADRTLPSVLIGDCVGVAGVGDAEIGIEARSWDTALECRMNVDE